jgi:5-methylcytosine-specific restriction endonuclease McrA
MFEVAVSELYDHRWRKLRAQVLREEGGRCYVAGCDAPATTVDHVVPVSEAPHLRLERSNLRAACGRHNFGRPMRRLAAMARLNRSPGRVRDW